MRYPTKDPLPVPTLRATARYIVAVLVAGLTIALGAPVATAQDPGPKDPKAADQVATDDEVAEDTSFEPEEEQKIRILLSAYDGFPTAEELLGVTPKAQYVLIAIYEDEEARASLRARALDALAYFQTDASRAYLEGLLQNEKTPVIHLHRVITSYGKAFGPEALTRLEPMLRHDDVQVRITAGTVLAEKVGKPGKAAVEAQMQLEKDDVVRKKWKGSLQKL